MKEYCRIATAYGQTMPGFPVRRGAVYGKNSGRLFVCENFAGFPDSLHVYVSRDNGKRWNREKINPDNKIFRAIADTISDKVPELQTFTDPEAGRNKVVGQPRLRSPQRNYLRYRDTNYQIRKTQLDNADAGSGVVRNHEAYYSVVHKDMRRSCVNNPLFKDRPEPFTSNPVEADRKYREKMKKK